MLFIFDQENQCLFCLIHYVQINSDFVSGQLVIHHTFLYMTASLADRVSIVGSLRDREVACSALDRQGSNFESCVWRTVSSQSSHHPQEVLLAQFSLYVHKGGLKPDSFHFIFGR